MNFVIFSQKQQFSKLKSAFPCIISSVRDFAEYIELDKDMFDLIIIDEASQVSIAQAFPALIRAKKVLIALGKVAFDACIKYFINYYNLKTKYKFKHDAIFKIGNF